MKDLALTRGSCSTWNASAEWLVRELGPLLPVSLLSLGILKSLCAAPQALVESFNPDANGAIEAMAIQNDGRIVVGGYFSRIGGLQRSLIARLNPDGTVDPTFNPGARRLPGQSFPPAVTRCALQKDGKLLVGGIFTELGGQPRRSIGRLNTDGTLDTSFNPGVNGLVRSLVVQPDGRILVGGSFSELGGQRRKNLGRLSTDGTLDTNFVGETDAAVFAVAIQPDGSMLVGGMFSRIGAFASLNIARLNTDGDPDTTFQPRANNWVSELVVQPDARILVGGLFTEIGGHSRFHLCRLNADGSVDITFNPGANEGVRTFAIQSDGRILVGGDFTEIGGVPRRYIARLNIDGSLDGDFNPAANFWVLKILLQLDGKMLVGGSFTDLGGFPRNRIGRIDPGEPLALPPSITVHPQDQVVPGGSTVTFFSSANGTAPLSYQWQRAGTNLFSATNATLVLREVNRAASGLYSVSVSNHLGIVMSNNALLRVQVPQRLALPVELNNGAIRIEFGDTDGGLLTKELIDAFAVQVSTDLANWFQFSGILNLAGGRLSFEDTNSLTAPHRFYRVVEK